MAQPAPLHFVDLDACVEATLKRVGNHIVLGLPVAIGKPNSLVNAFVRRATNDPAIRLTIITALSLRKPHGRSDLEKRLVDPLAERLFGDYPELEYLQLIEERRLPENIEVIEFYLEPGAWLRNEHLQQHYLSANYTHVSRDVLSRGINVIAQLVAAPAAGEAPSGVLSLSSNADLTADLLPQIAAMRAGGKPFVLIGQVHPELPFMYGDALVAADTFDFLVDCPPARLFAPPNLPIPLTVHCIALNVSALIRDGGTLQIGIGELGDAIVYALQLRHQQPAIYRELLEASGTLSRSRRLIEREGGTAPFQRGLYGCSEMLVDGFLDLYRSGIIKRHVYPSARLQRLIDAGHIDDRVGIHVLEALSASGMQRMSFADFNELRDVGLFRDEIEFERGMLISPDGTQVRASFATAEQREAIASHCLGTRLRNGSLVDAGFFFGPRKFYEQLCRMPPEQRRLFAMRGISFVNELYGHEWDLKVAQRCHARFVNSTMMVTGLGAAVSETLASGAVVSGVGGQYNFVAMAHALPHARSILCLRATRQAHGRVHSNFPWGYEQCTIPRHLRDIVVTEYGIANLRSKTDREVIEALVGIMDARFQHAFVRDAQRAGKLPKNYRIADAARGNTPEHLHERYAAWLPRGLFPLLPFGTDLTNEEVDLTQALKYLSAQSASWTGKARLMLRALSAHADERMTAHLARMRLTEPQSSAEKLQRRLVVLGLAQVFASRPTLQ